MKKNKKLVWVLIDQPLPGDLDRIAQALSKINSPYDFVITDSRLRPVSKKVLLRYLKALVSQVEDLE